MKRPTIAVAFTVVRSELGFCSMCRVPSRAVVACSRAGSPKYYGFCRRCVAGMSRVARVLRTARRKKGTC